MDFKTFFVFKGETTLRALVWFELWLIFFLVLVVTIWVLYIYIYIKDNKYYLNNIMKKVIPKSKTKFLQNLYIYI